MSLFLGCDPGQNGAIVALDRAGRIVAASRTLMSASDGGVASLPDASWGFWELVIAKGPVIACAVEGPIEFSAPGRGKSLAAVALSAGVWLGRLAERGCGKLYLVQPRVWQAAILAGAPRGETKARAEMTARGLWGEDARLKHSRGMHDGLVDSACLAEWMRQKCMRDGLA